MIDDDIPASPVAREIHARFNKLMESGGRIDRIMRGLAPGEKEAPLPDEEIERIKRNIEIQLDEYEQAINAAANWHRDWKARQPKGFRIRRNLST